jgi:outer membrane scaffolding protein for murein synthesis (MipA/OmpV family)
METSTMNHESTRSFCALLGMAALLAGGPALGAGSNEPSLVPLPSVLDFTRGEGLGVAFGAGVEYENAYDGADEREFEVEPAGAVHYRDGDHLFFWEGFELGWRGRLAEIWLVQAGARYEEGLEPDDSEDGNLDGLEPRDSHVVGFLEVRRGVGPDWRNWVAARVMGGPSDFGWLGVVAAGHRFGQQVDGTGTEAYAFLTFGTDDFINKDFGVTANDAAASGLPETSLDGGYRSAGFQLVHRRYLTEKLHVIGQAGVEFYSSDIGDSPIAREDYEFELGLSLLWHF